MPGGLDWPTGAALAFTLTLVALLMVSLSGLLTAAGCRPGERRTHPTLVAPSCRNGVRVPAAAVAIIVLTSFSSTAYLLSHHFAQRSDADWFAEVANNLGHVLAIVLSLKLAGAATLGMAGRLQGRAPVKLVGGMACAMRMAEAWVTMGARPTRRHRLARTSTRPGSGGALAPRLHGRD